MSRHSRRGSALAEFAFAGVPIIFTILSVMEVSRGMWTSSTLSYAVKEATRMAIVHGANCATPPNACAITVGTIARRVADSSQGLLTSQMSVTLLSTGDGVTIRCNPLSACLNNGSVWPAYPGNTPGSDILITASYPFQSPMGIFFSAFGNSTFGITTKLPASSRERIEF